MSDEKERAELLRSLAAWEENVANGAAEIERRRQELTHLAVCHCEDIAKRNALRDRVALLFVSDASGETVGLPAHQQSGAGGHASIEQQDKVDHLARAHQLANDIAEMAEIPRRTLMALVPDGALWATVNERMWAFFDGKWHLVVSRNDDDGHFSWCATHNEPAFPNEECSCGLTPPEEEPPEASGNTEGEDSSAGLRTEQPPEPQDSIQQEDKAEQRAIAPDGSQWALRDGLWVALEPQGPEGFIPPEGYSALLEGVRCRCINMLQNGGVFYCCKPRSSKPHPWATYERDEIAREIADRSADEGNPVLSDGEAVNEKQNQSPPQPADLNLETAS
jgi:hypothetical protein